MRKRGSDAVDRAVVDRQAKGLSAILRIQRHSALRASDNDPPFFNNPFALPKRSGESILEIYLKVEGQVAVVVEFHFLGFFYDRQVFAFFYFGPIGFGGE